MGKGHLPDPLSWSTALKTAPVMIFRSVPKATSIFCRAQASRTGSAKPRHLARIATF